MEVKAEEFFSLDNASLRALAHLSWYYSCTHPVNLNSCKFLYSTLFKFPDFLLVISVSLTLRGYRELAIINFNFNSILIHLLIILLFDRLI